MATDMVERVVPRKAGTVSLSDKCLRGPGSLSAPLFSFCSHESGMLPEVSHMKWLGSPL